jgi:hypothetical protein
VSIGKEERNGACCCLSRFRSVLAKRNGAVKSAAQFTKPVGGNAFISPKLTGYDSKCKCHRTKRGPISIPKRLVAGFARDQNATLGDLYFINKASALRDYRLFFDGNVIFHVFDALNIFSKFRRASFLRVRVNKAAQLNVALEGFYIHGVIFKLTIV